MGSIEDERSLVEEGLLQDERSKQYTGDGSVDCRGNPVLKHNTGNWRACPFILGDECCERLAYYGIAKNLVTYLTRKLHEGNVSAARNVTTWQGTCYLTPLIGAVLADAYWGRYWTIAVFSMIYFIGMCTLSISASVPALQPAVCVGSICPSATPVQNAVFFSGLYLIALGTGGIKPCVSSFGADQFDDTDPQERIKKGSFFNWFYFSINIGSLVSSSLIVWIQDNKGWGLGFGIPAFFMGLSVIIFFLGTPLYRFQKPGGSPITRMCQVVVASFRKRSLHVPKDSSLLYETPDKSSAIEGSRKLEHTFELTYLDKAAVVSDVESKTGDYSNPWRICTVTQLLEYVGVHCLCQKLHCREYDMDYLEEPRSPLEDGLFAGSTHFFCWLFQYCLLYNEDHFYTGDWSVNKFEIKCGTKDFILRKLALERRTGKWEAFAPFILGDEQFNVFLSSVENNLVTYLKEKPHEGTASAAINVTTSQGTCCITPSFGPLLLMHSGEDKEQLLPSA
ncbi:hypothetical protein L6164_001318 [Bauhinia variegata]|uniref:Uncharacterized protein n=1 Tax=Bauhinia variegata TaxID=167791 RepID=A0ACB9QFX4_BAUVA|nr:hypothetical protein L6164_001318 [Bauhinia variegata]